MGELQFPVRDLRLYYELVNGWARTETERLALIHRNQQHSIIFEDANLRHTVKLGDADCYGQRPIIAPRGGHKFVRPLQEWDNIIVPRTPTIKLCELQTLANAVKYMKQQEASQEHHYTDQYDDLFFK